MCEQVLAKEVAACCRHYMDDKGLFEYRGSIDTTCLIPAQAGGLMGLWWSEFQDACVFGCYVGDGCRCFSVLWGEVNDNEEVDDF